MLGGSGTGTKGKGTRKEAGKSALRPKRNGGGGGYRPRTQVTREERPAPIVASTEYQPSHERGWGTLRKD